MKLLPKLTMALMFSALVGYGRGKNSAATNEATLTDLNRAVATMTTINGRCPANVSELTNFSRLHGKRLPGPPAGKKLTIDPATRQVVFAYSEIKGGKKCRKDVRLAALTGEVR